MASALEALNVLAGGPRAEFVPHTPSRIRAARTCYGHMAGALGVALHDRWQMLGWLSGDYAAGSHTPAWIGASGVRIWEARGSGLIERRA